MDYILQSNLLIEVNMWSFSALLWCRCYFASKGQESIQIDFTQETCISICLNPLQICSTLKTALIYSLSYWYLMEQNSSRKYLLFFFFFSVCYPLNNIRFSIDKNLKIHAMGEDDMGLITISNKCLRIRQ